MTQIDYKNLFQTAILLLQYKDEKTISLKAIQFAFKILYIKNPLFVKALNNAIKYVTYFTSFECSITEFKKASKFKKLLKKYLDTDAQDIFLCDYRISSATCIYLCGLDDVFDGTDKEQYSLLGKEKTSKKKSKKTEPVPEDEEIIDMEEHEEILDIEEDEEDEEYVEEKLVKSKDKKNKGKTKNATL
jgi:hypothetical protein